MKMTPERFDGICARLNEMVVPLSEDPIVDGPIGLARKVAKVRAFLSETEGYLREVMVGKHTTDRSLRRAKARYEIQSSELLITKEIQKYSSIADRKAAVKLQLVDLTEEIDSYEVQLLDLGAAEQLVKSKLGDLKGTATDLRTQRNLMRDAESYGTGYGSEHDASALDAGDPGAVKQALSLDDIVGDEEEEEALNIESVLSVDEEEEALNIESVLSVDEDESEGGGQDYSNVLLDSDKIPDKTENKTENTDYSDILTDGDSDQAVDYSDVLVDDNEDGDTTDSPESGLSNADQAALDALESVRVSSGVDVGPNDVLDLSDILD